MSASTQLANLRSSISSEKRYFALTGAEIGGVIFGAAVSGFVTSGRTLGGIPINYVAGGLGIVLMLTANRAAQRSAFREFVTTTMLSMAATDVFTKALNNRGMLGFLNFMG